MTSCDFYTFKIDTDFLKIFPCVCICYVLLCMCVYLLCIARVTFFLFVYSLHRFPSLYSCIYNKNNILSHFINIYLSIFTPEFSFPLHVNLSLLFFIPFLSLLLIPASFNASISLSPSSFDLSFSNLSRSCFLFVLLLKLLFCNIFR